MAENQKLVPVLRFKDEQGSDYPDWEGKLLGEISRFSKGKGISKTDVKENGTVKCIRYGELYTRYGETISNVISSTNVPVSELVLSHKNDVIIPASGETALDIASAACITVEGVALGGDINIIRCQQNGIFLAYYLISKKKDIARLAQGISIVHLYSAQLTSLNLRIPSKQEQQKIANFLSSVDTKIEQLGKKKALLEQYKKGMMQKLFSQEIRFKDEQGNDYLDWEEKTLGEVAKFYSGGTPETTKKQYYTGNIPFIKSGEIAFSSTEQFISDEGLNNSSAKIVKKGDILYALYGATSGEVAVSKINGAINQAVLCIRSDFSHDFIYFYLNFKKDAIVSTYIQGGQGNLSAKIVKFLKINFPSLEEQQKVANFLSAIDKKIELAAEQLEQARTFKKGLLQRMFI